jgi:alpha-galactosidase
VHLSGRIDLLGARRLALVTEALSTYRTYRHQLAHALPSWPLGLPDRRAAWLALALHTGQDTLLAVWRRGGDDPACTLPVPAGTRAVVEVYPSAALGETTHDPATGTLRVVLPQRWSARLLRLIE